MTRSETQQSSYHEYKDEIASSRSLPWTCFRGFSQWQQICHPEFVSGSVFYHDKYKYRCWNEFRQWPVSDGM